MDDPVICSGCNKEMNDNSEIYEYRGAYSCADCFEKVQESRDYERQEIIAEEKHKLKPLEGMDVSPDTVLGKINREILKPQIEIASKESYRIKKYEGRE
jgi:hypothetical protein